MSVRRNVKSNRGKKARAASVFKGNSSGIVHDPFQEKSHFRKLIRDSLDPDKSPGKVRTLKDMTPEERKALENRYR